MLTSRLFKNKTVKKMIKKENYIQIQGWMVTDLKLSGNELLAYALIYGFSQDGKSKFTGSLNYVCLWLNITKPTAMKCLNGLVSKGLVIKEGTINNGVKFCKYFTTMQDSFIGGGKETCIGGGKDSLPNNTILDNTIIKNSNLQKNSLENLLTQEHTTKYGIEMITEFKTYWNSQNGKQTNFDKQKIFDIEKRLATWFRNANNIDNLILHNRLVADQDKKKAFLMLYPNQDFEKAVKLFYVDCKVGREGTSYKDYVNHFFNKMK